MAMTLPITIPSPPSTGGASPSGSDDSSIPPQTPVSPSHIHSSLAAESLSSAGSGNSTAGGKRKPSRRANTAERRATHNAVERQRRETLNGRFLDLAKLLPNLSQIRRPSKSAIVNSSIAHVHASRRHRALAARELRMMKVEADHLRRELNEWRDRAGIPRVEEPVRGEGFGMVLNQELEVIPIMGGVEEDDEYQMYDNDDPEEGAGGAISVEEQQRMMISTNPNRASPPLVTVNANVPSNYPPQQRPPFAHHSHSNPMIASPTAMAFSNPAMAVYDNAPVPPNAYPYVQQITPQDKLQQAQQWRRARSGSLASNGSASPPQMNYHPQQQQQPNFEPGWGGLSMQNMMGGAGMSNGVAFAMMM